MEPVLLVVAIVATAVMFVALPVGRDIYRRVRGPRVVVCPETRRPTEIEIDAGHAARSGVLKDKVDLRVRSCDRWTEGHRCNEACLEGVEVAEVAAHAIISPRRTPSR